MNPIAPTRLLMLDSGAFTVWNTGGSIDLDTYIAFCDEYPDISYYINLDVIAQVKSLSPQAKIEHIEKCCQKGFENYQRMIESLPQSKVVPVFHVGEHPKWIDKYLTAGATYLGLSPGQSKGTTDKIGWLHKLKPFLFDGAGRPLVKIHGFAVTTWDILKYWPWHSVDSATWQKTGSFGMVFVPSKGVDGEWDFTLGPTRVRCSANIRWQSQGKFHKLMPRRFKYQDSMMQFLNEWDIPLGTFEVKKVDLKYKLKRDVKEIWFNKRERTVLVPTEQGVTTTAEWRWRINVIFMRLANIALRDTVKHIYFAGQIPGSDLDTQMGKRLITFANIKSERDKRWMQRHIDCVRQYQERKRYASQSE